MQQILDRLAFDTWLMLRSTSSTNFLRFGQGDCLAIAVGLLLLPADSVESRAKAWMPSLRQSWPGSHVPQRSLDQIEGDKQQARPAGPYSLNPKTVASESETAAIV